MISADILAIDVEGGVGMEALATAIAARLTPDERQQFLADLDRWNARYAAVLDELTQSAEWQEIEHWRRYILNDSNVLGR